MVWRRKPNDPEHHPVQLALGSSTAKGGCAVLDKAYARLRRERGVTCGAHIPAAFPMRRRSGTLTVAGKTKEWVFLQVFVVNSISTPNFLACALKAEKQSTVSILFDRAFKPTASRPCITGAGGE